MSLKRFDRIIPLKYMASYPKSDNLDMVFYLPKTEGFPFGFGC